MDVGRRELWTYLVSTPSVIRLKTDWCVSHSGAFPHTECRIVFQSESHGSPTIGIGQSTRRGEARRRSNTGDLQGMGMGMGMGMRGKGEEYTE